MTRPFPGHSKEEAVAVVQGSIWNKHMKFERPG